MSTTGKLRRLDRDHHSWPHILTLDQLYFPRPWKTEDWDSLDLSQNTLWGWIDKGELTGHALFGTPADETAHLLKIFMNPKYQGTGKASEFWGELTSALRNSGYKNVYLEVEESNARAQGFYIKAGFQVLRRVNNYYSDGEGAVMMQLTL